MRHLTPDHEVTVPAAATAEVRRDPVGRLVIDLTDPLTGHVTRLAIPASHPGDARVTGDALVSALLVLDERLHDAEMVFEFEGRAA